MSGTRVFIGRLTYKARESDVERFFKGYGRVRDISLKNGYGFVEFEDSRDADDAVYELNNREILGERVTVEHARGVPRSGGGGGGGRSSYRGDYGGSRGYDRYESRGGGGRYHSSSREDRSRINYYESRAISKYGPPVRTKYRVVVENLSTRVSWQDLKDYLREAGEVTYADAHKHRQNEGVVDFATYDDMKRAIEKMDNTEINGRRIRLIEDTSFRSTSRSRSRSRSGGRSRSRSRSGRRSRSRSRSRSARRSASRSRSPRRSRSRSRGSRSRSRGARSDRSASKSRSRSRSKSPAQARSRDNSADRSSPVAQQQKNGGGDDEKMEEGGSPKAHSRSSSRGAASRSRSRSASAE